MFNYGQIIEYQDGTYSEEFNQAAIWCRQNDATLDELIENRKDGMRYFKINEIPKELTEVKPEEKPLTAEEQNEEIRKTRQDLYNFLTDQLTLRKLRKQAIGTWTEDEEQNYIEEMKKISHQIEEENPYIDKLD